MGDVLPFANRFNRNAKGNYWNWLKEQKGHAGDQRAVEGLGGVLDGLGEQRSGRAAVLQLWGPGTNGPPGAVEDTRGSGAAGVVGVGDLGHR